MKRPFPRLGGSLVHLLLLTVTAPVIDAARGDEAGLDVAPFALPDSPKGEIRFEEPRDIRAVEVTLAGEAPAGVGLSYFQESWPRVRLEQQRDLTQPCWFGWVKVDDWFNGHWKRAETHATTLPGHRVRIEFAPLTKEYPEQTGYDVAYRRTTGLRVEGTDPKAVQGFRVWTTSAPSRTTLRIMLNAGTPTSGGGAVGLDSYNARVFQVRPVSGCRTVGGKVACDGTGAAEFDLDVEHMTSSHRYGNDDGHVRFILGDDSFTISLASLARQGPIWFAERGAFIKSAGDPTTFAQYAARSARQKTIAQRVKEMGEQSYAGAFLGQPRPHSVATSLGFKQARQRFWLDCNGDLTVEGTTVRQISASDTRRVACDGNGRFFFGLERWMMEARYPDPAPALTYNLRAREGDLEVEQTSVAGPLDGRVLDGPIVGDRDLVCLVRFRFRNLGAGPRNARLRLDYSANSGRNPAVYPTDRGSKALTDWRVPVSPLEPLTIDGELIHGRWHDRAVLRARVETPMKGRGERVGLTFEKELAPDEACELLLKVPFVALDSARELEQLRALGFDETRKQTAHFWRRENQRGARVQTPVPQLDDLHRAHLTYVQISDPAMPGAPALVNTSVGTSTYSNCGNESCMINQELDQRGLADDAARRLEVWVHYQGTEPLLGRFSDHKGVLHGAGPFSFLASYNQNHGWILWRLAEHYLYTRDHAWFEHVAPAVLDACDWVARQRKQTLTGLPSSRGWERGFMPAGALEDVGEFRYWLTTNTMIWRGIDTAAAALEEAGHPEAARVRREADAFGADLRRGFETMRQHCPLVRLRDGRWVPYNPSQL
jgi:hypothetical protein